MGRLLQASSNCGLSPVSGFPPETTISVKYRSRLYSFHLSHFVENNMKIRNALLTDAESVSKLLEQLGYQASPQLIRNKLEALGVSTCDTVLLAQDGENIIGVISLHVLELFHQPGRLGRITSLVVDDDFRGQGIGAMLVAAADAFFTKKLCVRAEVTSSDHRIDAHTFYQRQGYAADERRFVKRYGCSS